jgi:DNA-binding response OmpR family regulator
MACKNPLNLSGKTWPQLSQTKVINPIKSRESGPFVTARTEGIPAGDRHLSLQGALRRVFESDGKPVVITLDKQPSSNLASRFESVSPAVSALVLLPFSWEELVTRVGSALRQSDAHSDSDITRFGDVCVDFSKMEVSRSSGERIALTTQEFKTLKCLLLNPDRVFSRGELLREAWGYENYPSTRTVDNHVLKLRQKLERDPARPVHFQTVHRVGYKFVP